MTFSLSTGLRIRVPNNQYLVPFVEIDRNGSRIFDKTKKELLMNGVVEQPATLGRYFLTSAYLMVDHDAKSFTLWQANPSTKSTLTPVVSRPLADSGCAGGLPGSPAPSGGPLQSSSAPTPANIPAVVGGVLGAVAGLAGAATAIFFFLRARKQRALKGFVSTGSADVALTDGLMERRSGEAAATLHKWEPDLPQEVQGSGVQKWETVFPQEVHGQEVQAPKVFPGIQTAELRGEEGFIHEMDGGGVAYETSSDPRPHY